jgi:hypothetical protein
MRYAKTGNKEMRRWGKSVINSKGLDPISLRVFDKVNKTANERKF